MAKELEFNAGRGNVSYAQDGNTLWIKVKLDGDLVTAKSGNKFVASGPVVADMGDAGKAHAWLNLNMPKASKSTLREDLSAAEKKIAELTAMLKKAGK